MFVIGYAFLVHNILYLLLNLVDGGIEDSLCRLGFVAKGVTLKDNPVMG